MVVVVAMGGLQMTHVLVAWGGGSCIVGTAWPEVVSPEEEVTPSFYPDKPFSKVLSNYCGDPWGLEFLWSEMSQGESL